MSSLRLLFFAIVLVFPSFLTAQQLTRTLVEGTGSVVELSRPASSLFVGDPSVADVRVVSGQTLFLAGLAPGTTNVFALDFEDELIATYRVRVVANNEEARATLGSAIPNSALRIDSNEDTAIIQGRARTLDEALAVLDARRSLGGSGRTIVDRSEFKGGTQVSLKVRFVQARRDALENIGLDLAAFGTIGNSDFRIGTGADGLQGQIFRNALDAAPSNVQALLQALEQQDVVEILSEPTLTTVSGRPASFHSGGEFAFNVPQEDGVITTEFRSFGVTLDFLPTVLPNKRIAIEVTPEVSTVDDSRVSTTQATPGRLISRAQTTVEVASGQTFAIAGLYEQRKSRSSRGLPGLSRSRIWGPAFGSQSRTNSETELIIFITPYLAKATDVSEPNRNDQPHVVDTVGFIVK